MVTAQTMSIFLAKVSERHAHECVVMVLDGAGWHQANDLEIPEHMKLVRLPPYSPELNPAEHLWDEIREKWFPNPRFTNRRLCAMMESRHYHHQEARGDRDADYHRLPGLGKKHLSCCLFRQAI
jgi:transposase